MKEINRKEGEDLKTLRELAVKIMFKTDLSGAKKAEQATDKVKKNMEKTGQAAQTAGQKTSSAMGSIASSTGLGSSAMQRFGQTVRQYASTATRAVMALQEAIYGVGRAADSAARSMINLKVPSARRISDKGGDLAGGGAALAAAGAAATAPLVLSANTAMDFEAAMSKVKAITGSTDEDMQKLTKTARELGAATQFSASESADAMSYLGMAGWDTKQIMAGMPGLLNLAAASGENLATTADIVSDNLTAFKMKAEDAGRMADVMAAASSKSNTNVRLMGETFKYAASVAGALGYSLEDVTIATGLMANAGIKGSESGTALRAAMTRLVKPPKEAADVMNKYGISIKNSDGTMKTFREVMQQIREKFKGMSKDEQAMAAGAIAGQEAMSGFLAVANSSDEDFDKLANAVDKAKGRTEEMAKTMNGNARGDIKRFQSAIEEVKLTMFGDGGENKGLPWIRDFIQGMTAGARAIAKFAKKYPQLVMGVVAAASAAGALMVALGSIGILIGGVMQLAPVFAAIGSAIAGVLSVGLWPLLAAFGAVASIIYIITNYWDGFVKLFRPGIDEMLNGLALLKGAWYNIQPTITAIMPLLKAIAILIGGIIVGSIWALFRVASFVFNAIASLINGVAYGLGKVGDLISWLADGLSGLLDKASRFLGLQSQMSTGGWVDNFAARAFGGGATNNVTQTNNFNLSDSIQLPGAAKSTGFSLLPYS